MMTFYAAAGSYQIRNEDGKDMPYIMRLGKLQPVSIPEFSIWSMLLWDVLTHDELRKKYFEKMEEVKLDPSGFEKALEMLVKRKLIIKGVGYTGADALYNMLYDIFLVLKEKQINEIVFIYFYKFNTKQKKRSTWCSSSFCCSEGALSVLLDKAPVMMRTVPKGRTL